MIRKTHLVSQLPDTRLIGAMEADLDTQLRGDARKKLKNFSMRVGVSCSIMWSTLFRANSAPQRAPIACRNSRRIMM